MRRIDARFRSRRVGKVWRYTDETLRDTLLLASAPPPRRLPRSEGRYRTQPPDGSAQLVAVLTLIDGPLGRPPRESHTTTDRMTPSRITIRAAN